MTNAFELASKNKLRFDSGRGSLSTEQLWDLSVEDLDTMYRKLNKQFKETQEDSLLAHTKSKSDRESRVLSLQLDIVTQIVDYKINAAEKAKSRSEKRAQLAQLEEVLATRANEEVSSKSTKTIEKMIADLKNNLD